MQRSTTALACLSVPGCRVALPVLEALSFGGADLGAALAELRSRSGADQVCLLSTCERTELYAVWAGEADADALARALAETRGVPLSLGGAASDRLTGSAAARHLLRVTAGLESFVLGERDIVGQVRSAGAAAQEAGVGGLELERLLATAVNTSRRGAPHTPLRGGRPPRGGAP